jgi:acetyltransferase-like isoleucine patch superfamily enzyme
MHTASSLKIIIKKRFAYTIMRIIQAARIAGYRLISTANYEGEGSIYQPVQLVGNGKIVINKGSSIGVFPSPHYLSGYSYIEARSEKAVVRIGDNTWINNNFVAIAEHSHIDIGKNVLIGTNVEIYDSDFHGLAIKDRRVSEPAWSKSVKISDDVFLGSNVKILKGVTVGAGTIVANGSIVIHNIPANVIAGGIPAKVLRTI